MVKLIANWILNGLAIYIVSKILPGFVLEGFGTALLAVIVIGLINTLVKPILLLLTLPINIVTLGLFTFFLNALLLLLASSLVPGFKIHGFATALLGSILLTIISNLLHLLVR